ncbi:MAG: thioredoxin fold domain-containing protein [Gammaproteobacteria bacterium]|nr:thioredoxin fold domain-containing protein [Gammaproteobacteria bacterium]
MASEGKIGDFLGAKSAEKPEWFKESFLEFEEDVAEAAAEGRRVMLYFYQDGCPYCARLIEENFADPAMRDYIIKHFDGITLNMWGDREVVSVSGQDFTEKTFARALKVQYTPTLVFLDEAGKVALRLNGYYPPRDFRAALDYVVQKREREQSFADFRLARLDAGSGKLIDQDFFLEQTNLQALLGDADRPLAVYFETADCAECSIMHERILTDGPTRKLVIQASNVQFDLSSSTALTTPDGRRSTVREWATELGIAYTPSVVFFDAAGKEVMRIDAFLKTFHFQSVYDYVLEKAYLTQPQFQRYIEARADRIREAGYDADIWGYESFHE